MSVSIYEFIVWATAFFAQLVKDYPSVSINYWREDFMIIKHQLANGQFTVEQAKEELRSNISYKKLLID